MIFYFINFINIVIGCILGAITSWLISYYYWKLNEPTERILTELKKVLPHYLHPLRYPQFYTKDSATYTPEQDNPIDFDIPYTAGAIFSKNKIFDKDHVEVLLNLVDEGRNLNNPAGVKVRDHLNRSLPVKFSGLGYASISFVADYNLKNEANRLTISLKDTAGNENIQSYKFHINQVETT